jgi:hypothetical protein
MAAKPAESMALEETRARGEIGPFDFSCGDRAGSDVVER